MLNEIRLVYVLKTARNWAINRVNDLKKLVHPLLKKVTFKANEKLFIKEVTLAGVHGEMSALERTLQLIKDNPEMTREDIEAELHLSIVSYNNYISSEIGQKDLQITLDDYLKMKEYI